MKFRWIIPIALLIPLRLSATDAAVGARVATITINPKEITVRPILIRLPFTPPISGDSK